MFLRRTGYSPGEVSAFFAAISVVVGARAFYLHRRANATLHWRPVEGTITWSMMETREVYRRWSSRTEYRPDIKYSYTIGSTTREGTRIYFGADEWLPGAATARGLLDQYPPGKSVHVFVDLADPTETVLSRGQDQAARRLTFGAVVAGAVAVVVYLLRRKLGTW